MPESEKRPTLLSVLGFAGVLVSCKARFDAWQGWDRSGRWFGMGLLASGCVRVRGWFSYGRGMGELRIVAWVLAVMVKGIGF